MATFNDFDSFIEALCEKVHNLGSDALTLFLTNVAPVAGNTVLANITQISYTNLSSRVLTISSSGQSAGSYAQAIADKVLTASGGNVGPFRYIGIFNDTAGADELLGWWDYGASITLLDGESMTVDFPASFLTGTITG